jgi:hypothetical protein
MGLTLSATSKDFHYDEKIGDYVGETGSLSTDIGYFSYKFFRDDLIKYCTKGIYKSIEDVFGVFECYQDDETYKVATIEEDFTQEELKDEQVEKYLIRLKHLKNACPKLYDCFPFVMHCDCDGEMPYTQLENVLPILQEYKAVEPNKQYGYKARKYDFLQDLIDIIKQAIEMKGKLRFA